MIIKKSLNDLRKVSVCVAGSNDNKFKAGKKSTWFTVYDATPDEVLKVIMDALRKSQ